MNNICLFLVIFAQFLCDKQCQPNSAWHVQINTVLSVYSKYDQIKAQLRGKHFFQLKSTKRAENSASQYFQYSQFHRIDLLRSIRSKNQKSTAHITCILSYYIMLPWNYETNSVHAMEIAKMCSKSSTNTKSRWCCLCMHDIAFTINNSSAPHVLAQTLRFITEWMEKRSRMTHRYPISAH